MDWGWDYKLTSGFRGWRVWMDLGKRKGKKVMFRDGEGLSLKGSSWNAKKGGGR